MATDTELDLLRETVKRYRQMAEGELRPDVAARISRLADALERLIRYRERRAGKARNDSGPASS